jgi:hypothetical protein
MLRIDVKRTVWNWSVAALSGASAPAFCTAQAVDAIDGEAQRKTLADRAETPRLEH